MVIDGQSTGLLDGRAPTAVVRNYPTGVRSNRSDRSNTLVYNQIEGASRQTAESHLIFGPDSKLNPVTYSRSIPIKADFPSTGSKLSNQVQHNLPASWNASRSTHART